MMFKNKKKNEILSQILLSLDDKTSSVDEEMNDDNMGYILLNGYAHRFF